MDRDNYHNYSNIRDEYKIWFFAGGETRDDKFNIFTGSFIRLMKEILEDNFDFIRGIYFKSPMMNVIWALNHAQRPLYSPQKNKMTRGAFKQIVAAGYSRDSELVITSSSSGSVIAAQTACYLAWKNRNNIYFKNPFHLVLGASIISRQSELFSQLLQYQRKGAIGTIIYEEVQDEGDSTNGIGGLSRKEAYVNAFGLMFPVFSRKFNGPSFLNTNSETGHIHRKRSKTVQKAIDYINVILIKHRLAGDYYMKKAAIVIRSEIN
jgi:hypothetical protein